MVSPLMIPPHSFTSTCFELSLKIGQYLWKYLSLTDFYCPGVKSFLDDMIGEEAMLTLLCLKVLGSLMAYLVLFACGL